MASIKIRAKVRDGVTTVKSLINHPMETGLRKDRKTGEKIPPHFIRELTAEHNGRQLLVADWGTGISKNPYLSFRFKGGNKGDKVTIRWVDNKGNSDSAHGTIK